MSIYGYEICAVLSLPTVNINIRKILSSGLVLDENVRDNTYLPEYS